MNELNSNGEFRILVADDEPLVRRSISELLTSCGYKVSSATAKRP